MTNPSGPVIWIVEDDPSTQRLITDSIRLNGFACICYGSAEKAYTALRVDPLPDLIILDMLLPGMSGVDLIRLLKQNKQWSNIPVVVVTVLSRAQAYGHEPTPSEASEESAAGANPVFWVRKPFGTEQLIRIVQGILASVGI